MNSDHHLHARQAQELAGCVVMGIEVTTYNWRCAVEHTVKLCINICSQLFTQAGCLAVKLLAVLV